MATDPHRHDKLFADCFSHNTEGYAIYKLISADEIKPGTCGYFDDKGNWDTIAQLVNADGVEQAGWSRPAPLEIVPRPGKENWGEVKSSNVVGAHIGAGAGGGDPNGLVAAGANYTYKTTKGAGAIFLTKNDITETRVKHIWKLDKWMESNGEKIANDFPPTQTRGVWIVEQTCSAPTRTLTILEHSESEVSIRINVDVFNRTGHIEADADWLQRHQGSMWKKQENTAGLVLFMLGKYYRPKFWGKGFRPENNPKKEMLLGDGEPNSPIDITIRGGEDGDSVRYMQFVPEKVGELFDVNDIEREDDEDNF